jgi:serine/threonine protein kinase
MGADAAAEEQFGPYLVYERLGVGGMATVHRARERGIEGFERIVALKRLLPHLAEDASFIKSFVREAKLASLLNHVNIVQIFELGRVGSEYFISMEYIDGKDIRQILRHARRVTGPPPIHVTVGLMLQLCDALDYAHGKADEDGVPLGLVHRDVSPSNLLITSAGHLKVIDFGIAKAQSAQLRTQTGRVKGKLAYMAPEAIAGKDLDARSDLFAAGVILHELLTARPLFASKNEYQTLLKVQRGDIMPPSTFNQACPPELDGIALRALARDPDDRFLSAGELREELTLLRKAYNLQTGVRDVSGWVDWAFSLEPPSGSFTSNTLDTGSQSQVSSRSISSPGRKTPRPASIRKDEEEAVEIAWGGGGPISGPVLLDEIPDVSEKHLAARPSTVTQADDDDDIPTPLPSHGRASSSHPVRATTANESPRSLGAGTGPIRPPSSPPPRRSSQNISAPIPKLIPSVNDSRGMRARTSTAQGVAAPASEVTDPNAEAFAASPILEPSDTAPSGMRAITDTSSGRSAFPVETAQRLPALDRGDLDVARGSRPPEAMPQPGFPRTRPGMQPVTRRPADRLPSDLLGGIVDDEIPARAPTNISIGASILAHKPRRAWPWILFVLVLGGGATGATLYLTRDQQLPATSSDPAPTPSKAEGTLRIQTEPQNAEASIDGKPVAVGTAPLSLAAGPHQIEIHHTGFKAWLTSIDLAGGEIQTLRVVLEPLGGGSAAATSEATLKVASTPNGLEVVLDGTPLEKHTPLRTQIKIGPHVVVLRKDGTDVWRQELNAAANINYEYNPSFEPKAKVEVAKHELATEPPPVQSDPAPTPAPTPNAPVDPAHHDASHLAAHTPGTTLPNAATGSNAAPPLVAQPTPVQIAPLTPPPPPPPAPKAVPITPTGPILVAPTAVTRLSGGTPSINKSRSTDMPPVVAAKVCIDLQGRVSSADLITKIERHANEDLVDAIKQWQYAPYKKDGKPVMACFVVSFRVK